MLRGLLRIGVHRDDREVIIDAPHRVLEKQPRADREHHVRLAPQFVAERQRHGERVAAVEYALATAESAQHGRLQQFGERGDLGRGILRAAADHDHRVLRRGKPLCGIAERILVDCRLLERAADRTTQRSPACPTH